MQCIDCREWVTGGLLLDNGDTVCGKCFADNGYLVCLNCGDVYNPKRYYVAGAGYCEDCGEDLLGICWQCDNVYLRDQLGTADDGEHYLCAKCENEELSEIINDPSLFKFTVDDYYEAYDEGFDEGYDFGYEDGTEEGYKAGNKAGHDAGYEEGYKAGHEDGRKEGYTNGYDAGVKTASSVANSSNNTKSSSSSSSNSSSSSQTQSITVYITKTGSKYHRSGCQYLSKSKISISLDDAKARGYTACSRCW